jgi:serine kinase of HPr protein (carbohydrate metabolism regulator)
VPELLHATLVADRVAGRWAGALIRGVSGAGKSTLALRALQLGFQLVADDRVTAWRSGGVLYGKAPAPLAGLIEVRGIGVLPIASTLALCPIELVVDLAETTERLPDAATLAISGMHLPHLVLGLGDPDAALRLRAALAAAQHAL